MQRLTCFLVKLTTIASVFLLFTTMVLASFDAVNFVKVLILLFTAVLLKKVDAKNKKAFTFILLAGLLLLPYTKVIFAAFGLMILFDLVSVIYKKYDDETSIILKLLSLIGIVWIVAVLEIYIYPSYLNNPTSFLTLIILMSLSSFTFFIVMINLLVEIFQSSSRVWTG